MKKYLRMMMVVTLTLLGLSANAQTSDPIWQTSEDGFYEISTAEELHNVRNVPEGNFRLMNDIDLTEFLRDKESGWEPIDFLSPGDEVMRYFDGNNHTIRGLWIDRPGQNEDGTGLFGNIQQREISKLTVEIDSRGVTGFFSVGGLAGMFQRGSIIDCGVKGGPVKGSGVVGGMVGYMMGPVTRSYSLADVSGQNMVGGLIGSHSGNMSQSYAMGNVQGTMIVGGLVASQTNEEGLFLRDSYATGDVMALGENPSHIGGLIGYQTIPVYNSYAAGKVTASNAAMGLMGGIAGDSQQSEIVSAFFRQESGWNEGLKPVGYWEDTEAAGRMSDTGDLPQGITATQFMTASTFPESWHINEGRSDDTPWLIKEGESYPYLWWQEKPYPQPPGQNPAVPTEYHTITLEVAPGIDLFSYTPGKLLVEDGSHLYLQFLPEDRSLMPEDILFLVDGVETSFKNLGANHYFSYILNPIREDHTVLIALKEYEVAIPRVDQVQSDPVPGIHKVGYGEPFTLILYPDDHVTLQGIHVYANGIELEHDSKTGYALSLHYMIEQVMGPVSITIKVDDAPVGNIDPAEAVRVYSANSELIVETTLPQVVQVYNITGALQVSDKVNGRLSIPLSKGIYMVKVGAKVHKVVVK